MTRSRRDPDPHGVCDCGKQRLTRDGAHRAVRFLNSRQQSDHHPVHAYRCGAWWHLGHVPQAARKNQRGRRTPTAPRPLTPRDQLPPELQ